MFRDENKRAANQADLNFEGVHQQWVATLDAVRDSICVVDQGHSLLRVNAAFASLAKRGYADLIGINLGDVLPWLIDECGQLHRGQVPSPDGRLFRIRLAPANSVLLGRVLIIEDVSDHAALQIAEAKYNEGKARSLIETIEALSNALDAKDPYTAQHSRNVAILARRVAIEAGLSEFDAQGIFYGARVHDIGKLGIPSGILNRPGRLAEAELNLIYTHSQTGGAIVSGLEFPWPVQQIVVQHHERMDGSGYPDKLQGDEIHMAARIVAVADVVEAMSAHRPYRPSLGIDAARDEIESGAGTRYDEAVVAACLRLIDKGGSLYESDFIDSGGT